MVKSFYTLTIKGHIKGGAPYFNAPPIQNPIFTLIFAAGT